MTTCKDEDGCSDLTAVIGPYQCMKHACDDLQSLCCPHMITDQKHLTKGRLPPRL